MNAISSSSRSSPPYATRTFSGASGPGVRRVRPLRRAASIPSTTRARCDGFMLSSPQPALRGDRRGIEHDVADPRRERRRDTGREEPTGRVSHDHDVVDAPTAFTSATTDATQSSTVSSIRSAGLSRPARQVDGERRVSQLGNEAIPVGRRHGAAVDEHEGRSHQVKSEPPSTLMLAPVM